jgi:hypothetical protein
MPTAKIERMVRGTSAHHPDCASSACVTAVSVRLIIALPLQLEFQLLFIPGALVLDVENGIGTDPESVRRQLEW